LGNHKLDLLTSFYMTDGRVINMAKRLGEDVEKVASARAIIDEDTKESCYIYEHIMHILRADSKKYCK
jgi:hypothetical protein